jgi:hypothetical protein
MKINNMLIRHNQDKEISLIERFIAYVYGRKLSHYLRVHVDTALDVSEKNNIFRSVIF